MKIEWENNGEANAEGQLHAIIDLEDGSQPQHFYGASHKELTDKLLQAQANASQRIRELKGKAQPEIVADAPAPRPRQLSADERFTVSRDITDPAKVDSAISTVIEARLGRPLEDINRADQERAEQDAADRAAQETRTFIDGTPEYYPCEQNNRRLLQFMQNYVLRDEQGRIKTVGLRPTQRNFQFAFEQLTSDALLLARPAAKAAAGADPNNTAGGERIVNPPTTRPRGAVQSTGIRNGDSSGVPGRATAAKPYTRADIEAMSQRDYDDKMANEAGFAKCVDELFSPARAAR